MILRPLQRQLRNLAFANQILIIQMITIGLILTILSTICFLLINKFQQFVQDELVESVIQKSVVSGVKLIVGQIMRQTLITSNQQGTLFAVYNDLYNFQLLKNIRINEPLEECDNTFKLNSYQFCYNGQFDQKNQESQQFQQFIQLQNTIAPFTFDPDGQNNQFHNGFYNQVIKFILYKLASKNQMKMKIYQKFVII